MLIAPKSVSDQLEDALASMKKALEKAKRKTGDCKLVAVSKTHPIETIKKALEFGHRAFGENRIQEANSKWVELKKQYQGIELHLIGSLQTNKVSTAVELFDVIETLDRFKLAKALKIEMDKQNRDVQLLIQVNTGGEEQKGGVLPKDLDALMIYCKEDLGLFIKGLMCIPPVNAEPSMHFALLYKLAKKYGLTSLSMGMSGDYDVAIQFGATHIRVGTGVFGNRSL
ncbi:MAG: YggS family pyridoxal phosphate-dependent enzyme [Sphingomonadales bacterium]